MTTLEVIDPYEFLATLIRMRNGGYTLVSAVPGRVDGKKILTLNFVKGDEMLTVTGPNHDADRIVGAALKEAHRRYYDRENKK